MISYDDLVYSSFSNGSQGIIYAEQGINFFENINKGHTPLCL